MNFSAVFTFLLLMPSALLAKEPNFHDFSAIDIHGNEIEMKEYVGKVNLILICSLTSDVKFRHPQM